MVTSWLNRRDSGTNSTVWMEEEHGSHTSVSCESAPAFAGFSARVLWQRSLQRPGLFTRKAFLTAYIYGTPRQAAESEEIMNGFFKSVAENALFAAEFLLIIAAVFLAALALEKLADKKNGTRERAFSTRKMAVTGMFSAMAMILHLLDFPLPFAPDFYKLDFSELPVLVGAFAFGPVVGVTTEAVKILLKLFIKGTSTAFVGDLANFVIGCSFILPASAIYYFKKNKKRALAGCIIGTLLLTLFGTAFNAVYLLPAFSRLYGMPLDSILAMGSAVNPLMAESSIVSFVACCVAPMNLIKGGSVSLVTMLVYKPLSPIIKGK